MPGIVDDLLLWKEVGIGLAGIYVFYQFATMVVKIVTNQMMELEKRFVTFIEDTYKENTKTLTDLVNEFKEHNKMKDEAILMLEKRHDELKKEFEEKYERLRKYHEE